MKTLFLLFLFINLIAQDDYSFRVAYGKSTNSNLGEIFVGDIKSSSHDYRVLSFDGGYLLKKNLWDIPLDIYLSSGLGYYDEDSVAKNVFEGTLYFKFFYNLDFWQNRVRIGFGEGISYTNRYLRVEYEEAVLDNDRHSKYLNYLDISFDIDLGLLADYKPLNGTTFGWAIRHRSGIKGLINSVEEGGVNYNTLYIESNF
ncbi:MAG: hypothetical protein U9P72_08035 [Campylobacterota bacterium]|nr:hypothetical protein [Campylobacterota bacterium]